MQKRLHAIHSDLRTTLSERFGLQAFRHSQESIIQTLLSGRDVLVVMPTGGGKSLCYQLPALLLKGVTLVVSPLISLMQDQVERLLRCSIPATFINSTLTPAEQRQRIVHLKNGAYKLVYIAPERFRNAGFMQTLEQIEIALFAVDEAHCISQWGHDFRPDYLHLGPTAKRLGAPPIGAFTATATPEVQDDIVQHLNLRDHRAFVTGFARPNLAFRVTPVAKRVEKWNRINRVVAEQKTGIIYCATRKHVEAVAMRLHDWGIAHVAYHGGMDDEERVRLQDRFMQRKVDVAVATNAFGMGIDRPDIRFVTHFEMPGSLEAYYQEAGRAGRDGHLAICELLFNHQDKQIQEFFIEASNPSQAVILDTYTLLRQLANAHGIVHCSIEVLAKKLGHKVSSSLAVGFALSILNRIGIIERFDVPGQRILGTRLLHPGRLVQDLPLNAEALERRKHQALLKLQAVITFATSFDCRQEALLRYFGETDRAHADAVTPAPHGTIRRIANPLRKNA